MKLFHNSQDIQYRTPFGAVKTGTEITLRLCAGEETPDAVWLRLFRQGQEEKIPMKNQGNGWYAVTVSAGDTPCLLWYDFMVEAHGRYVYYSNSQDSLGGIGTMSEAPAANSYQITVYDKNYQTPEWFRGKVMYQIFPDRFCKAEAGADLSQKRGNFQLHQDWYAPPADNRHPFENGPAYNDFYGGNLKGIMEKLPYLKDLGVGVIYLNPIFEAYSNHRYDTGDYKKIDPILGDEESFRELCRKAEELGIRIILGGVFSHTGADSIYFNKYGTYGEGQGAYQSWDSPYGRWYQFADYPNYQSWWGCSNLPNVNEMENSYLNYILRDEDAVIKKWIRLGASGWRLDVADELPDEFIRILRTELKRVNPDGVIIGEVWEDASNKTAYSQQREYLLGHELDSVMNYPFRDGVLAFLTGQSGAEDLNRKMLSQMENYPKETLHSLMNMLGTHDTMRVKSMLGGMEEHCGGARLTSQGEELATRRLMLGAFLQMTFYGV
ncbi:MAG: glycoside hydrolase family 13 protein, partial [Clostridia bacterium]|nr:glycoside hydrolase family 13 protein [Clostridia bacterium]